MKKILIVFWILVCFTEPVHASGMADADHLLKNAINTIVNLLNNDTLGEQEKRVEIQKKVESVFDFKLMAKLTLGKKNWQKFSRAEQHEFADRFSKQLQNSYYSKIEFFSDETINYEKPKKVKKKVHILTWILLKDKKIDILYKLYHSRGKWKIYDAEINGVSIVMSYRAQYKQFLAGGSVHDFLAKMKKL